MEFGPAVWERSVWVKQPNRNDDAALPGAPILRLIGFMRSLSTNSLKCNVGHFGRGIARRWPSLNVQGKSYCPREHSRHPITEHTWLLVGV
jgi:hypothetical protein